MLLWHWLNQLIKQLILLNKQIDMKALPVQVVLFSFRKSLFYFATLQFYCFIQWGEYSCNSLSYFAVLQYSNGKSLFYKGFPFYLVWKNGLKINNSWSEFTFFSWVFNSPSSSFMVAYCFSVTSKQRIEPSCGRFAHSLLCCFYNEYRPLTIRLYTENWSIWYPSFNRNWRN